MAAPDYNLTGGPDGLFQSHDLSAQILSKTVDFSKYTGTAAGVATKTADVITIPAGFVVENVFVKVLVAGTASSTITVGDSSDADNYVASVACDGTAGTVTAAAGSYLYGSFATTPAVSGVYNAGKLYSTADAIRLTLGATPPTTGKVQVVVKGYQAF